jgi:hypothetical protein
LEKNFWPVNALYQIVSRHEKNILPGNGRTLEEVTTAYSPRLRFWFVFVKKSRNDEASRKEIDVIIRPMFDKEMN